MFIEATNKVKKFSLSFKIGVLFSIICAVCPACGEKQGSDAPQFGVDGYVYVAEPFSFPEQPESGITHHVKYYNGSVYYLFGSSIWKAAFLGEGRLGEAGVAANLGNQGSGVLDYTVDEEGNLYILSENQAWPGSTGQSAEISAGYSLSKVAPDGEAVYQLSLSEVSVNRNAYDGNFLALESPVSNEGSSGSGRNLYLLATDGIYLFGLDGTADGKISTEISRQDGAGKEVLAEGENGKVYYCVSGMVNGISYQTALYEVQAAKQGGRLEEKTTLTSQDWDQNERVLGSPDGILYLAEGNVAQYRQEEGSFQALLRLQDSNLPSSVSEMARISEGQFLVKTWEESSWYLLTKTSVDEIQPKEMLLLASTYPSGDLTEAIARFNRTSNKYHVILETFKGEGWKERLDARIVSKDPPDLLDMSIRLDIRKYADKQGLEDLRPYLENSALLDPDAILGSVLEGYTIDERLVCIPSAFQIRALVGRSGQVGTKQGWSMEEFQKTLEEFPQSVPVQQIYGYDSLFNNIMINVCGDYLLERFIDWNAAECHFQDREFLQFIEWLADYCGEKKQVSFSPSASVPEELLLMRDELMNLMDFQRFEILFGEECTLKGFPTASGDPLYYGVAADEVGILSNSKKKEGAWSFLEYFLTSQAEDSFLIPSRRDWLESRMEEDMTQEYYRTEAGEVVMDQGGEPLKKDKGGLVVDGEIIPYYAATQEQEDLFLEMIDHTRFYTQNATEQNVLAILQEEMSYYVRGEKTLEDVTDVIQNRVNLLLKEA